LHPEKAETILHFLRENGVTLEAAAAEWERNVAAYLMAVNGGALGALLVFFEKDPTKTSPPVAALICFAVGVVLVGSLQIAMALRMRDMGEQHANLVQDFYFDRISLGKTKTAIVWKEWRRVFVCWCGIGALGCFALGMVFSCIFLSGINATWVEARIAVAVFLVYGTLFTREVLNARRRDRAQDTAPRATAPNKTEQPT
jgi:hypothetical protein